MERLTKLILGIISFAVVLELLLGPGLLLFAGICILFLLWGAQGGMTEGNPYKRMKYSGVPDFLEVKDYMRKQDIEERDNADAYTTMLVFTIGMILICIDVLCMWFLGWL